MISGVNSSNGTAADAAGGAQALTNPLTQKDMFLKLLVAQIKNQNPLNPADSLQYVSQMTQFTELEQLIQIRTDLDAILSAANAAKGTAETTGPAKEP